MSPNQQNGWLLRVQHTLYVTDKENRHLSKKTNIYIYICMYIYLVKKSKSVKSFRYMDEFFVK